MGLHGGDLGDVEGWDAVVGDGCLVGPALEAVGLLLLRLLEEVGMGYEVEGCAGDGLRGECEALVGYCAAAHGDELPAVAGCAEDVEGGAELDGWALPADVAYVAASGHDLSVAHGVEYVGGEVDVEVLLVVWELDLAEHVHLLLPGEALGDLGGEGELLLGVCGGSDLAHVLDDCLGDCPVGDYVVEPVDELDLECCLGHEGRPFGDLEYAPVDGVELVALGRAYVVPAAGVVGDHVGLPAPDLDDIVEPRLLDDVFA